MRNIWFTSDPHHSHKNIAGPSVSTWDSGYRDFNSVEDMNSCLVDSFNIAQENDIIYCLGDWSFGGQHNIAGFRQQIKCKNIHLIFGNHDEHIETKKQHQANFSSCQYIWKGKLGGRYFYLHHFANRVWEHSHKSSIHLYGHSHGSLPDDINALSLDVGWETSLYGHIKYSLYHIDEIISIMDTFKSFKSVDHHKPGVN